MILRWLEHNTPDILCLQETKVQDHEFPHKPLEAAGYHCRFKGQKSYNGVAILSKQEPADVRIGFGADGSEATRLITATIGGIQVVNTYIPQGRAPDSDQFEYKIIWLGRLREFFGVTFNSRDPLIWLGDFNIAPEPIDVYDPEKLLGSIGYHPREHQALKALKDWGFDDVYRLHNPLEKAFTFWDYRIPNALKRGLGWRLDHIWATQCVSEKSRKSWIDVDMRLAERPSDHTFIAAEFECL